MLSHLSDRPDELTSHNQQFNLSDFLFRYLVMHGLKAVNFPPCRATLPRQNFVYNSYVFVLQVYVQVNKEAEHNEGLKQAARDFFRQLEQHESRAVSLWQQFREITVNEYELVYKVRPSYGVASGHYGQNLKLKSENITRIITRQ